MNTIKVKTTIKRPSRYQQQRAMYELTASGLAMATAVKAVREVEEDYSDVAASAQEGAHVSPDAWHTLGTRHAAARKTLAHAKRRISGGQGVNGTRQTPTLEAIC